MAQVFENIIRNAWEASVARSAIEEKHYGELSIRTESRNGAIRILFQDNGIGMQMCEECGLRDCRTCRRWRVGNTTKETGSGLGMVYVMEKLLKNNGDVRIQSGHLLGTSILMEFKKNG
jgi:nitrogen fixation/metabolism regulation signal transduction histidine kinase